MKINKPKFWHNKNSVLSIIFFPISFLILILIFLKKNLQNKENLKYPLFVLETFMLEELVKHHCLF